MKSAILSVGTELLFGQIVNTNTVYLSQQLNLLGHDHQDHNRHDQEKHTGNQVRRIGDIDFLQLLAPGIQLLFGICNKGFHLEETPP